MKKEFNITKILILIISLVFTTMASASDYSSVSQIINKFKKKIIQLNDLDEDVRLDLSEMKIRKPGIVIGDFDGNGEKDVALLIKSAESDQAYLQIYLCRNRCEVIVRENYDTYNGLLYMEQVTRGTIIRQTEALINNNVTKSIKLKNSAIRLVTYGKSAVVYYWDAKTKEFNRMTTAD